MEIFNIENLSFTYPLCQEKAVDNVSFTVKKGEFITLCGATGSGKSTLLRLLKPELAPLGEQRGVIYFKSRPANEIKTAQSAAEIGFVMQRPEQQAVTDKVWHELCFGLENLNIPKAEIARRVAETASFFGIEDWYEKSVSDLSGGQKQLLNLAAVTVMQPEVIILDEPTAQLDPIAASNFISALKKLNRELSLTVIIAEHRLEEVIPLSDRLLVMEKGRLLYCDTPYEVVKRADDLPQLMLSMPASVRLYRMTGKIGEAPLDVRGGRDYIERNFKNGLRALTEVKYRHSDIPALEFKNACFRYGRNLPDVLCGLELTVYKGEIFCILGGNGSGKTTLLCAAAGNLRLYGGSIKIFGKDIKKYKNMSLYKDCVSMLPQDVQTVFLKNTVKEELCDAGLGAKMLPYDLSHLYSRHPYDLSGGEQQLVALAKALSTNPALLLMDEPTKGLDAAAKKELTEIIKRLKSNGVTVVAVTHDAEFAASCADRCALFFRGNIVSEGVPSEFFSQNRFYTTAASRMTAGYYDGAVTVENAAELCLKNGRKEGEA